MGACFIRIVSTVSSPGALFFIFLRCVWTSLVVTGSVRGWCSVEGLVVFLCDDVLCLAISLSTTSFHVLSKWGSFGHECMFSRWLRKRVAFSSLSVMIVPVDLSGGMVLLCWSPFMLFIFCQKVRGLVSWSSLW